MRLIGIARLGRDAEIRYLPDGKPVANFSLAYNYGKKTDEGRPTQWIDAALWGERAERLTEHLTKGTLVFVSLRDVHIETYEGKNGTGHKLAGTVEGIEFVPRQRSEDAKPETATAAKTGSFDDMDDDIPF